MARKLLWSSVLTHLHPAAGDKGVQGGLRLFLCTIGSELAASYFHSYMLLPTELSTASISIFKPLLGLDVIGRKRLALPSRPISSL